MVLCVHPLRLVNIEAIKYEWSLEPLMMKLEAKLISSFYLHARWHRALAPDIKKEEGRWKREDGRGLNELFTYRHNAHKQTVHPHELLYQ